MGWPEVARSVPGTPCFRYQGVLGAFGCGDFVCGTLWTPWWPSGFSSRGYAVAGVSRVVRFLRVCVAPFVCGGVVLGVIGFGRSPRYALGRVAVICAGARRLSTFESRRHFGRGCLRHQVWFTAGSAGSAAVLRWPWPLARASGVVQRK